MLCKSSEPIHVRWSAAIEFYTTDLKFLVVALVFEDIACLVVILHLVIFYELLPHFIFPDDLKRKGLNLELRLSP